MKRDNKNRNRHLFECKHNFIKPRFVKVVIKTINVEFD